MRRHFFTIFCLFNLSCARCSEWNPIIPLPSHWNDRELQCLIWAFHESQVYKNNFHNVLSHCQIRVLRPLILTTNSHIQQMKIKYLYSLACTAYHTRSGVCNIIYDSISILRCWLLLLVCHNCYFQIVPHFNREQRMKQIM